MISRFFILFLLVNNLSMLADETKKYLINVDTLGQAKAGSAYLKGFAAGFFNPSLSEDCVEQEEAELHAKKLDQRPEGQLQHRVLDPKKQCQRYVAMQLPFFVFSRSMVSLFKAKSQKNRVAFLTSHVGEPFSFIMPSYLAYVTPYGHIALFDQEFARALISRDLERGGVAVASVDFIRSTGVSFSQSFAINQWLSLGVSPKFIRRQKNSLKADLTDISEVKHIKDIMRPSYSLGVAVDTAATVYWQDYRFSLLSYNTASTKFYSKKSGRAEEVVLNTFDFGIGREILLLYDLLLGFYFDYQDITGNYEKNFLKKIHFGSKFGYKSLYTQGGLDQGNIAFGLGWRLQYIEMLAGISAEELGDKIGFRPDYRAYGGLRYQF